MYIIFTCIATPPLAMKCAHKLSYCIHNDTYIMNSTDIHVPQNLLPGGGKNITNILTHVIQHIDTCNTTM